MLEASGQKNPSRYKEVPIDNLSGLSFLYIENNLRQVFSESFELSFKELTKLDLQSLRSKKLDYWSKKVNGYDKALSRTEEVLLEGQAFFNSENISKFKHFFEEEKSYKSFLRLLSNQFGIVI